MCVCVCLCVCVCVYLCVWEGGGVVSGSASCLQWGLWEGRAIMCSLGRYIIKLFKFGNVPEKIRKKQKIS